ncbi:MAG: hypothetical protein KAQ75_11710, partial [Bacteroidales bacterium]|nr:hypothetical protein [Bacteroidales bacterium]
MIFLSKLTRYKESKHFILLLCFVSLTLFAVAQTGTGVINNGAKMIINTGAVMKITGTGADYTNTTDGTHGRIDLDGKIEIEGDWTNNATSGNVLINVDTDGEVIFNGSSTQNIAGSATSDFENLTINNSSGLSLSADAEVGNVLTLTSSLVTLNSNNIIIGATGSLSGTFTSSNMFVTNSTGTLRKSVVGVGSFTFPIGENTGTAEYSPVDFTLNSYTVLSNAWVSAKVINAQHGENTSPSEYLTRYWTLSSSGITSPVYSADFNYLQADVVGTEASIYAAEYDGSARTVYSTVDATNNILPVTGLSSFADYTGVDGTVPTVLISTTELDPTNTNPIPFTATFSEEVTGFTFTDITIDNGSTSSISTSDNIEFTFDVIPTKDSIVTIDINAGVAEDIAGNDNTAATTYRIEYDGTDPLVNTLYPEDNQENVALTDNLQMTFNELVYLNTGNIEIRKVTGGTLVE